MQQEPTRYLFIGEFDSVLMGLYSKRGEVIWVSSLEEALNQTGNFSIIVIEKSCFNENITGELTIHYPNTPIIVSNGEKPEESYPSVRFVPFHKILTNELAREEVLAKTELRVEQLRKAHSDVKKLLILVHDHPDPDSIASALALRVLLKRNRQTALIGHFGEKISRPENVAMIDFLEIELENVTPDDLKDFDSIALVDVQPPFFGNILSDIKIASVIDHHPQVANYEVNFSEIKTEEGATSTILTKYLRAAQVDISERLATALLYGIKTDTVSLNRDANPDDVEAFTFLYPNANLGLLRRIERAEIPPAEVKCFGQALADHWISNGVFFVNLGRVKREYLIPKMADLGIQVKGVEWSVAFGILGNSHLIISVRNVGYVKSAGRLVREMFTEIGSAGGHRSAAKAVIPLSKMRKILGRASQVHIKKWITKQFSEALKDVPDLEKEK
ncbi:MAG TPA: DHH family phosphoesterase [Thermodesulfobacteriota bacterium]|nr:DHH family phosphoesterase [Thermodesulfobacteriota bacterium]